MGNNKHVPNLVCVGDERKSRKGRVATVTEIVVSVSEDGDDDGSMVVYTCDGFEYTVCVHDFVRIFPYVIFLVGKWRGLIDNTCMSLLRDARNNAKYTDKEYIEAYFNHKEQK